MVDPYIATQANILKKKRSRKEKTPQTIEKFSWDPSPIKTNSRPA
jgi:hypothetical protein